MNLRRRTSARSSRFRPQIEALEDRQLNSANVVANALPRTSPTSFLAGSVLPSSEPTVFRTGGAAFLEGSVLHVALSLPAGNEATLTDDGHRDVTVEWNGHPPQTFHHVGQVIIESVGRQDAIRYTLTGNVTKAHEVDVELADPGSTFTPNPGGFQANCLTFKVIPAPAKGP